MSTRPSRRVAVLACALAAVAAVATPASPGPRGAAVLQRFTPSTGGFSLSAAAPAIVHPNGKYLFALVANRLICTVDAASGEYVTSYDLGVDVSFDIARQRIAPMSISEDGAVIALPAAGKIRFFDVDRDGRLTVRSEYDAPTGTPAVVGLSADGTLAVFASGPVPATLSTVRTRDSRLLDALALSVDETPISSEYSAARKAISIVTPNGLLIFRHDDNGTLSQTGAYPRAGFAGDAYSGIQALGKRGRVTFTIEEGGSALIGISLKGKQTGRAPARQANRFSSPIKVSADGKTIVATNVNGQTGAPAGLLFYKGDARGIVKGDPDVLDIDPSLGPVAQLAFDPTGALLAVTLPSSSTVLLVDVALHQVLTVSHFVGSAEGVVFTADGTGIVVSGAAGSSPLAAGGAAALTIIPIRAHGLDESRAMRFSQLPGVIFGAGDGAYLFPSRFFGVATSEAADALFTFNVSSGREIQRVDLGRSTGLLAVAPDARTMVVSSEGGLAVYQVDDSGGLRRIGDATPGAETDPRAASVAFDPARSVAFVTAGPAVWRVDLTSGASVGYTVAGEGDVLTNPMVGAGGTRLFAISNGTRLVRCSIAPDGRVSLINSTALQVALDPDAPHVAYDAAGAHMWACGTGVVRQYNLLSGIEEYATELASNGRDAVLVAPDLLAVVGDPVVFLALGASGPVAVSEVATGGEPHGAAGVDSVGRRVFVGVGERVVAVDVGGGVLELDGGDYTLRVVFTSPPVQVSYPDVAGFPGSVVVARGF